MSKKKKILKHWFLPSLISGLIVITLFALVPYYKGYYENLSPIVYSYFHLFKYYNGDWAHCLFIPFIVAGLIYLKRKELKKTPIDPTSYGIAPIIFGLFFYWVGFKADVHYFGYFGLQILYAGLILWFLGWQYFKKLLFIWLFLGFMYPLPVVGEQLTIYLRHLMTDISVTSLNLLHVPSIKVGTGIFSAPNLEQGLGAGEIFKVDVADPCSGIRSLFALLMVSTLYGYLILSQAWQRWVIFLSAIFFALLGNVFRILMLTIGTMLMGADWAVGSIDQPSWFHSLAGFFVFVIGLLGIVGMSWLLEKIQSFFKRKKKENPISTTSLTTPPNSPHIARLITPLLLVIFTLLLCYLSKPPEGSSKAGVKMDLPLVIGDWVGFSQEASLSEKTILPSDTEFERKVYRNKYGERIFCSIVLSGAEKRSIHRPEICLPGNGWNLQDSEVISVTLNNGRILKVMKLRMNRTEQTKKQKPIQITSFFLYWFVGDASSTPYHWTRILKTSLDRIFYNVQHRWAYILVAAHVTENIRPNGKNETKTLDTLKKFISEIVPEFQISEMPPSE